MASEIETTTKCSSFRASRDVLKQSLNHPSQGNLTSNPWSNTSGPITTSIFDYFKVGPGPSSSHTIGPMKAAFDFLQDLRKGYTEGKFDPKLQYKLLVHLHGSLSLTGKGHGTDRAVVGGLLGWLPPTCDPIILNGLLQKPEEYYRIPIAETLSRTSSEEAVSNNDTAPATPASVSTAASPLGDVLRTMKKIPAVTTGTCDSSMLSQLEFLSVGQQSIIWHEMDEAVKAGYPHPNTVIFELISEDDVVVMSGMYFSVGGGFIQKHGHPAEDARDTVPKYPYRNFEDVKKHLEKDQSLTLAELVLQNEMALTNASRNEVIAGVRDIIGVMEAAVVRGLHTEGLLPGPLKVVRKAAKLYRKAQGQTNFLLFLNAYCLAASEENAAGHMHVTAPTSGASGVYPGLIYFMKNHLCYDMDTVVESFLASCTVAFITKRNSSISGAEMGCMGETGVASSMGAMMLAYAAKLPLYQMEAAAEIAMEHHLGLTCDPVGGYVMIPCIERNPMAAVKAYNSCLMASGADSQKISFDKIIEVMAATGRDMDSKYRETSLGGLAVAYQIEC